MCNKDLSKINTANLSKLSIADLLAMYEHHQDCFYNKKRGAHHLKISHKVYAEYILRMIEIFEVVI